MLWLDMLLVYSSRHYQLFQNKLCFTPAHVCILVSVLTAIWMCTVFQPVILQYILLKLISCLFSLYLWSHPKSIYILWMILTGSMCKSVFSYQYQTVLSFYTKRYCFIMMEWMKQNYWNFVLKTADTKWLIYLVSPLVPVIY